jgi:hypothetical protein
MKVNAQLELTDCKFNNYRGSTEIINHKNFRIMGAYEQKIKANLQGVRLNKVLTKDLHYPV